jgi:hypothetical protein
VSSTYEPRAARTDLGRASRAVSQGLIQRLPTIRERLLRFSKEV